MKEERHEPLTVKIVPGRFNRGLVRKKEKRYYCACCLVVLNRRRSSEIAPCWQCRLTMHRGCHNQHSLTWGCRACTEEEYGGP